MNADYRHTASWLKERIPELPAAGLILGTGLGDLAEELEQLAVFPYSEIPGFSQSTAPSHKGNLVLARLAGKMVFILQGRFHYYEGHAMEEVVFPTRTMAAMGIKNLFVTNAAGSLRKEMEPGSLIQIIDHINFMGTNPLIGSNDESMGERFPSMNQLYDPEFLKQGANFAQREGIRLQQGVYMAVTGPSLETKAECAAFANMGADLVGMSTVPEVIVARHAGIRVAAFSIVTNYSNLFHDLAHSQEEIRANAARASVGLKRILGHLMEGL
ncbi:MAG: purine-nucleoside phosphorylase [Candidatus Cloacimonetes bacterium]|nr:purine-nucleoside phosphorylase [Candidatus Cloacimonadota bacterium]NLO11947.1 purine-nucleoside phosphorylase [Candidatus Cloacimonadota bacterium]